jgi:hypothetical protein
MGKNMPSKANSTRANEATAALNRRLRKNRSGSIGWLVPALVGGRVVS